MKKNTLAALLLMMIGAGTMLLYWWLKPDLDRQQRRATSDAENLLSIRVGGDDYLGYWFLTSPEMRKGAARRGLAIDFRDDGGAYAERLAKFAAGELDCVVLPVNSYVQHGRATEYPGVIVAAVCESRGADGILVASSKLPSGKVEDLNNADLTWVYTPDSPSSYLVDLLISDFDLYNLAKQKAWRSEVDGSKGVLDRALAGRGDVFVLWEPQLSQALAGRPDLKYVWGSDKFAGYIIDVLVVRRDFLQRHRDECAALLETYFQTLKHYQNNRPQLLSEIQSSRSIKPDQATTMLTKIDFFDLIENCRKGFGIALGAGTPGTEAVINCILSADEKLSATGVLTGNDPEGWPYVLVNSSLVKQLGEAMPRGAAAAAAADFRSLSADEWKKLREVGTIRVDPISFRAGATALSDEGKAQVDRIAAMLVNNYPDYRVAVRGHTGLGDAQANQALSQQRAESVGQRLVAVHRLDRDRLLVEGLGSSSPPSRREGETNRQLQYRMPRVEFVLLEDAKL